MALVADQNNHLPMSLSSILTIGGVTMANILIPFLTSATDVTQVIGGTLNVIVGAVGIVVLFLLRNNIKYHITFSNIKNPSPPAKQVNQNSEEDESENE